MRFRKLRIAWSVGCVVVCGALLIALWMRSYSIRDSALWETNKLALEINSIKGHAVVWLAFRPFDNEYVRIFHEKITRDDELRVKRGVLGFFYFRGPDNTQIHVPLWFLTLAVMAAVAVLPWIHWRFRLRTLLIATTLVAVVLGLIVWLR